MTFLKKKIAPTLVLLFGLGLNASSFADQFADLRTESDALVKRLDDAVNDTSDDSIVTRRAKALQATIDGMAFIKKVIRVRVGLTQDEKRILVQDVAREIGMAYADATDAAFPVTMESNAEVFDVQNGESRVQYWMRTGLKYIFATGYGVLRDLFAAISPIAPRSFDNGIPQGWIAADAAASKQAKEGIIRWRMPSILPALMVTDHLWDIPFVGRNIPTLGTSERLDIWAWTMAQEVRKLFENLDSESGEVRELGHEATMIMFADFLAPAPVKGQKNPDQLYYARSTLERKASNLQRGVYIAIGLLLVKYGWDYFDAGSEFTTQSGVLMSRLTMAFAAYAAVRNRTVSTTVKAANAIMAVYNKLVKANPKLAGDTNQSMDFLNGLRNASDAARKLHCEAVAGDADVESGDTDGANTKKKKGGRKKAS